ncbi:MAG: GNAT family N-acetyltransferase [Candidatus Eremiobacteraeota bacterium]|nr:GNAT family N-acetyltransferase [Candidatus Eremiobacteraeota bacterium]
MIIRHFQASDFSPVTELLNRSYRHSARMSGLTPDRFRSEINARGGNLMQDYLVLEGRDSEVLGFCGYSTPASAARARMDGPIIAYSERGQGLGQRMWHELADLMRSRNVCSVSVLLEEENRVAAKFLGRLGFKKNATQIIVTCDRPFQGRVELAPGITVRKITEGEVFDRDAYITAHGKLFESRSRQFLDLLIALPDYTIFVAEKDGRTVGFLELELVEDTAIIESFGVMAEQRRRGYGSSLLKSALEYAWQQDGIKLVRQIWKTEQPEFLQVYTALGFKQKTALHHMEKAIG